MKFSETFQYLDEGKKLRRAVWDDEYYVYINPTNEILIDSDGDAFEIDRDDMFGNDWEICPKTLSFIEMIEEIKRGYKARNLFWKKDEYLMFDNKTLKYHKYKDKFIIDFNYKFDNYDVSYGVKWIILDKNKQED